MHAIAETHPFQKLGHILLVIALLFAEHAEGKRHVFPGRQVIEQAEILEHDADAAAQIRPLRRRILGNISAEEIDKSAAWPQGHEQKPEKRCFPRPRRASQKVKGAGLQMEIDVAQNFLPDSIPETDAFEINKSMTSIPRPQIPLFALALIYDKRAPSSN